VFPQDVIATASPRPEAIADKLQELLGNSMERERLSKAGSEFAGRFSWEDSAKTVEGSIQERILTHAGAMA
jgi:glycosyltransferase involved in cell wall biosynthesis